MRPSSSRCEPLAAAARPGSGPAAGRPGDHRMRAMPGRAPARRPERLDRFRSLARTADTNGPSSLSSRSVRRQGDESIAIRPPFRRLRQHPDADFDVRVIAAQCLRPAADRGDAGAPGARPVTGSGAAVSTRAFRRPNSAEMFETGPANRLMTPPTCAFVLPARPRTAALRESGGTADEPESAGGRGAPPAAGSGAKVPGRDTSSTRCRGDLCERPDTGLSKPPQGACVPPGVAAHRGAPTEGKRRRTPMGTPERAVPACDVERPSPRCRGSVREASRRPTPPTADACSRPRPEHVPRRPG
ncbi:hypothetical protein CLV72_103453 [Allonocardiopsis opalescens]|uniref:Uncharacterized protein n=1 Tax=Allonocardiopsis opalescens TaxID=1144618 RepID=A0A2T0Q7Q6_9ACTN|nr:hypothetical protein CLV72_103453 [Allonocardiopsis opalescens]